MTLELHIAPLERAIVSLEAALGQYDLTPTDIVRDACIQRFEYTYELSYKMLKAKDAANACRLALEEGVLPGAATSLVKAAEVLGAFKPGSAEDIFSQALLAPHKQLIENNGGKKLNLKGVWDSALVVKNAVRNAISLSGIILTISGDIRLPELTEADKQIKILSMQQNRVKF